MTRVLLVLLGVKKPKKDAAAFDADWTEPNARSGINPAVESSVTRSEGFRAVGKRTRGRVARSGGGTRGREGIRAVGRRMARSGAA